MNLIKDYYTLKDNIRTEFIKYWYYDEEEPEAWLDYLADTNEGYWIGNGNVMGIGDVFVSIEDIIYIFENNVDKGIFLDWYWEPSPGNVNLQTYIAIHNQGEHEDFLKFQEEQERIRNTPEYKKKVKAEEKKDMARVNRKAQ